MKRLVQQIEELISYVQYTDKVNESVSKTTVGWQIDHAAQVLTGICYTLEQSDPKQYKWKFSLAGNYVMLTGKIPRGVGKAPKEVRSQERFFEEQHLLDRLAQAKAGVEGLPSMDDKAYFHHPYFGDFRKKKAVKFVGIHTEHHLKIIRDMLR